MSDVLWVAVGVMIGLFVACIGFGTFLIKYRVSFPWAEHYKLLFTDQTAQDCTRHTNLHVDQEVQAILLPVLEKFSIPQVELIVGHTQIPTTVLLINKVYQVTFPGGQPLTRANTADGDFCFQVTITYLFSQDHALRLTRSDRYSFKRTRHYG